MPEVFGLYGIGDDNIVAVIPSLVWSALQGALYIYTRYVQYMRERANYDYAVGEGLPKAVSPLPQCHPVACG